MDNLYNTFDVDEFESSKRFYPRWTGRRDKACHAMQHLDKTDNLLSTERVTSLRIPYRIFKCHTEGIGFSTTTTPIPTDVRFPFPHFTQVQRPVFVV